MTHFQSLYDRDYLGSWDLPENRDIVVTIEKVVGGELTGVGGKKSKKPVISFVGKEKKFICNKTNAKTIAVMYGPHVEKWQGKQITLYVGMTRDPSSGGEIACIRIRPQIPAAKPQARDEAGIPPTSSTAAPADSGLGEGGPI